MSGTDRLTAPRSPLSGHAIAGRYGNPDAEMPGIKLTVLSGCEVVRVSPFAGQKTAASAAVRKVCGVALPAVGKSTAKAGYVAAWAAMEAWYVSGPGEGRGELHAQLEKALGATAAVVDQTHGVTGIRVDGPKSRDLLAKGCPIDLDPDVFAQGACAATQMEHNGVHLRRAGKNVYELHVPTSQAVSFWHFLCEMALEFGYEVSEG